VIFYILYLQFDQPKNIGTSEPMDQWYLNAVDQMLLAVVEK
jgi:hypothetical protein